MRQPILRGGSLLILAAFLLIPSYVSAQPGKKKEPSPYIKVASPSGQIKSLNENTKQVTITISQRQLDQGQYRNLQQGQLDLRRARRPQDVINARRKIAQAQARLYKLVKKDITLQSLDEVEVRTNIVPQIFDEKGNLVRPSREKLKELKGDDPRKPGYLSEWIELTPGQIVTLTVVQPREALKRRPIPRGKDIDLELLAKENSPKISMILIVAEPAQ